MARVLVIEDEKNQRILYEQELSDRGYEVVAVASGQEAIEEVEKGCIDIAILDIRMPSMDGIETLGKIVSIDNTIPVILHTGYASQQDNFMTWTADAYMTKSADIAPLVEKIEQLLKERASEPKERAPVPKTGTYA